MCLSSASPPSPRRAVAGLFGGPGLWARRTFERGMGRESGTGRESEIIVEAKHVRRVRYYPLSSEIQAITSAAFAIFSLTSSTLLTLTLVMLQSRSFPLPRTPFPVLEELSLYRTWIDNYNYGLVPSLDYRLPTLRRLHLGSSAFSQEQVKALLGMSPQLTDLRFSEVENDVDLYAALAGLVRGLKASEDRRDEEAVDSGSGSYPSLETILIQPRPLPHVFGWTDASQYVDSLRSFQKLKDDSLEVEVTYLAPRESGLRILDEEAKEFWIDRLGEGQGCWDTGSKVDLEELLERANNVPRSMNRMMVG
ncbi:hypothetical protein JAAARDRAFT_43017 [Jaapia argillacea MUCL 33604]|uniref:Uncharacterized protein n=1 Tax=Jaapia argillacea MUCL 33604 TaxID=933084 RepID=A0A067PDW2_9AGAM|nr:hypothetical protein JAAARDRAFT_43017 [Jaapia argillacea MUCL 33604]